MYSTRWRYNRLSLNVSLGLERTFRLLKNNFAERDSLYTRFAFLLVAVLAGCASEETQVKKAGLTAASKSLLIPIQPGNSPYGGLGIDQPRIPLTTDFDVAWDEIAHRGNMRWECRGVPSGKFVANSLCAEKPRVDSRWPDKKAPPNWSGVLSLD